MPGGDVRGDQMGDVATQNGLRAEVTSVANYGVSRLGHCSLLQFPGWLAVVLWALKGQCGWPKGQACAVHATARLTFERWAALREAAAGAQLAFHVRAPRSACVELRASPLAPVPNAWTRCKYVELDWVGWIDCRIAGTANDYSGELNLTRSGRRCQAWAARNATHKVPEKYLNDTLFADQSVINASNFCRNPSRNIGGTWCYTEDPKVKFDVCHVPDCDRPDHGQYYSLTFNDKPNQIVFSRHGGKGKETVNLTVFQTPVMAESRWTKIFVELNT
ncbi:Hepatocyte growth factor-like protein [Gryllus bimaculatus]|nr:Hepatocyte growth factor-like protein [Gryllus bimaculatus]